ncbi:MAG: hypothetical protein EHM79_05600 [Geobacter sp.]|nr:MAG: hypothetical protein EHM79_05600 [Geobacter sp.]
MSQEMVERLLGRLLTDDQFRHQSVLSLAESCQKEGFFLSCEELESIRHEDLVLLEWVAIRLDKNIRRFSPRHTTENL